MNLSIMLKDLPKEDLPRERLLTYGAKNLTNEELIAIVLRTGTMNTSVKDLQARADKLIQNAEYLRQKRINEAKEQVAMFQAMYAEYAQNPAITRSRMYYETISQVLPGVKLYINSGSGSNSDVQMLLPLESLVSNNGGNAQ